MSEYQRYEFMTCDQPLTRTQLDSVNTLSSHIEASSTHALIEYNWGDFKHDPIKVLHTFFDGFLYWANWGTPRLVFRFPHGLLPATLIDGYDLADFVTFTRHPKYDILDIHFSELESPDIWTDYELGSFISVRDELMDGDLRSLYIVWLAAQRILGSYDEEEDYEIYGPSVPPGFATLTAAQQELADLFQVPQELLEAAAQHSQVTTSSTDDDFAAWIALLPPERSHDYLLRLAHNEPGLSRLLVKELRKLNQSKTNGVAPASTSEHVTYATLLAESKVLRDRWDHEEQERQQAEHQRHMLDIYHRQDEYWQQINLVVARGSGTAYDEATRLLSELREATSYLQADREFQECFSAWVQPHLRRPALIKRLQDRQFPVPRG